MDAGNPTGDGGGGAGCWTMHLGSIDSKIFGRDDASIALERSWLRVSELAKESRRRS